MSDEIVALVSAIHRTGRSDLMNEFAKALTEYLFLDEKDDTVTFSLVRLVMEKQHRTTSRHIESVKNASSLRTLANYNKRSILHLLLGMTNEETTENTSYEEQTSSPQTTEGALSSSPSPVESLVSHKVGHLPLPAQEPAVDYEDSKYIGTINGKSFSDFAGASALIDHIPPNKEVNIVLSKLHITKTIKDRNRAKTFIKVNLGRAGIPIEPETDFTTLSINGQFYESIEDALKETSEILLVSIGVSAPREIHRNELEEHLRQVIGERKILRSNQSEAARSE